MKQTVVWGIQSEIELMSDARLETPLLQSIILNQCSNVETG